MAAPVKAECWNFTTGELFTLHPGQRVKVLHVYDAHGFTCEAVNEAGECAGIDLNNGGIPQRGYRFIISNSDLRRACPSLRPIPRINFDVIGAIIKAES